MLTIIPSKAISKDNIKKNEEESQNITLKYGVEMYDQLHNDNYYPKCKHYKGLRTQDEQGNLLVQDDDCNIVAKISKKTVEETSKDVEFLGKKQQVRIDDRVFNKYGRKDIWKNVVGKGKMGRDGDDDYIHGSVNSAEYLNSEIHVINHYQKLVTEEYLNNNDLSKTIKDYKSKVDNYMLEVNTFANNIANKNEEEQKEVINRVLEAGVEASKCEERIIEQYNKIKEIFVKEGNRRGLLTSVYFSLHDKNDIVDIKDKDVFFKELKYPYLYMLKGSFFFK